MSFNEDLIMRSDAAFAMAGVPAWPIRITFDAKEGEQELPGTIDRPGRYYKVTVRQLKDDEH